MEAQAFESYGMILFLFFQFVLCLVPRIRNDCFFSVCDSIDGQYWPSLYVLSKAESGLWLLSQG